MSSTRRKRPATGRKVERGDNAGELMGVTAFLSSARERIGLYGSKKIKNENKRTNPRVQL